jgi:hypothetical protein
MGELRACQAAGVACCLQDQRESRLRKTVGSGIKLYNPKGKPAVVATLTLAQKRIRDSKGNPVHRCSVARVFGAQQDLENLF